MSIKDYLASRGIHPVKNHGYYGMYRSPFREDTNASLKVDYNKNLWIDFGSNEGGTLIDLVMRINNCSLKQAIYALKFQNHTTVNQYNSTTVQQQNTSSFHVKNYPDKQEASQQAIAILKIQPLNNQALIDYLNERYINPYIARQHCKEIHYTVNNKEYFAIGFQNEAGGWELRSKYFKGCTSKDISIIRSEDMDTCLIFEGFMDYLSFLTMKNLNAPRQDTVILNSIHNLSKAMDFIKSHKQVYTYLDNDESGWRTTQAIKANCGEDAVSDQSAHYAGYKDLNDYLSAVKQAQKPVKKQSNLKPKL
ncbi:MAG: toprim domain-containing protein [Prevotella sp.]|nr:toprim domain-containing protein [Prevotella sp.]